LLSRYIVNLHLSLRNIEKQNKKLSYGLKKVKIAHTKTYYFTHLDEIIDS